MKKTIKGRIGGNKNGKSTNNSAPTVDNFSSALTNAHNGSLPLPPVLPFEPVPEEDKCRLEAFCTWMRKVRAGPYKYVHSILLKNLTSPIFTIRRNCRRWKLKQLTPSSDGW